MPNQNGTDVGLDETTQREILQAQLRTSQSGAYESDLLADMMEPQIPFATDPRERGQLEFAIQEKRKEARQFAASARVAEARLTALPKPHEPKGAGG